MCSNEIAERVKCVERKSWDFHHWQARSTGFRHPSGQQNPASIWTFNHEVDQTRVDYAPEDCDPPPNKWMMRIFNDDLEVVFLGSMSLDCAESAKVGSAAHSGTRPVEKIYLFFISACRVSLQPLHSLVATVVTANC
jgi:hypothetical protein